MRYNKRMSQVPGTQGYEQNITRFVALSQAQDFTQVNRDFLPYLPAPPARVLDLGAGVGQNAAALADLGYAVVAVEPLALFRSIAQETYADRDILWIEDHLPPLQKLGAETPPFDFILLDGVWHHLNADERPLALARIAQLLNTGGKCALSLRNGPAGMGSHIFPIEISTTLEQARQFVLFKPE